MESRILWDGRAWPPPKGTIDTNPHCPHQHPTVVVVNLSILLYILSFGGKGG